MSEWVVETLDLEIVAASSESCWVPIGFVCADLVVL
jgi:hypothetical protein